MIWCDRNPTCCHPFHPQQRHSCWWIFPWLLQWQALLLNVDTSKRRLWENWSTMSPYRALQEVDWKDWYKIASAIHLRYIFWGPKNLFGCLWTNWLACTSFWTWITMAITIQALIFTLYLILKKKFTQFYILSLFKKKIIKNIIEIFQSYWKDSNSTIYYIIKTTKHTLNLLYWIYDFSLFKIKIFSQ